MQCVTKLTAQRDAGMKFQFDDCNHVFCVANYHVGHASPSTIFRVDRRLNKNAATVGHFVSFELID
ncbi:protein of unknown function [Burkholderia multivorans]